MTNELKKWIRLVEGNSSESLLNEAILKLELKYGNLKVVRNPNQKQTTNMLLTDGTLRGLLDCDDNLYIWDAAQSTHSIVEDELGIAFRNRFMLQRNGLVTTESHDQDEIEASKSLQRALGGEFEVEFDGYE